MSNIPLSLTDGAPQRLGKAKLPQLSCAAAFGLPSSANEDLSLLAEPEDVSPSCAISTRQDFLPEATNTLPDALPRPQVTRSVTQETLPSVPGSPPLLVDLGIAAAIVGDTFSPTDVSLAHAVEGLRASHRLCLPSFDTLGIAAPHPDRYSQRADSLLPNLLVGAGPLSRPEDPLHIESPSLVFPDANLDPGSSDHFPQPVAERSTHRSISHFIPTLTPSEEPAGFNWGGLANVRTVAMESPASDPENSNQVTPADQQNSVVAGAEGITALRHDLPPAVALKPWLKGVLDVLVDNVEPLEGSRNSVKILSHALPSPSITGHTFPAIIESIRLRAPARATTWINVFHALPGQFQLSDLPTSPPSTPGPAVGGEDYFTTRVFDSAIRVDDYQGSQGNASSSNPVSPIVAPGSVDISILERYIPPTNSNEFGEMFSTSKQSPLHDRLVELTSSNGTLIFIYPTRTGALTFTRHYLGPVIEPLLRSTCIVHGISMEAGRNVAQMQAVDRMLDFSELKARLGAFCDHLSDGSASNERYHGPNAKFSIVYSAKEEVLLTREVWAAHWWNKQEKPRITEIMNRMLHKGADSTKHPDEYDVMASNLVKEILDNVIKSPYGNVGNPIKGIEVGVFVIRKTT